MNQKLPPPTKVIHVTGPGSFMVIHKGNIVVSHVGLSNPFPIRGDVIMVMEERARIVAVVPFVCEHCNMPSHNIVVEREEVKGLTLN